MAISSPPPTPTRQCTTRRRRTGLQMVCRSQVLQSSFAGQHCKPHPRIRPHRHIGLPGTRRTRTKPARPSLRSPQATPQSRPGQAASAAGRLHSRHQARHPAIDTPAPRAMVCLGCVRHCRTCSSTRPSTFDSGVRVTARQLQRPVLQAVRERKGTQRRLKSATSLARSSRNCRCRSWIPRLHARAKTLFQLIRRGHLRPARGQAAVPESTALARLPARTRTRAAEASLAERPSAMRRLPCRRVLSSSNQRLSLKAITLAAAVMPPGLALRDRAEAARLRPIRGRVGAALWEKEVPFLRAFSTSIIRPLRVSSMWLCSTIPAVC